MELRLDTYFTLVTNIQNHLIALLIIKMEKSTVKMGSYGIGVSRLVGALIEAFYIDGRMKWPRSVSPFDVVIIPSINKNNKENLEKSKKFTMN